MTLIYRLFGFFSYYLGNRYYSRQMMCAAAIGALLIAVGVVALVWRNLR